MIHVISVLSLCVCLRRFYLRGSDDLRDIDAKFVRVSVQLLSAW